MPDPVTPADVSASAEVIGAASPVTEDADDDASGLPQVAQNVSVARAAVPQRGQFIGTTANYPANAEGAQHGRRTLEA
jgi:hypothetical protein